jgi:hypothetical protein
MFTRKMFLVVGATLLCTIAAFGQASGNFTYGTGGGTTACVMDSGGNITGGQTCQMSCTIDPTTGISTCTKQTGTCIGNAIAGIKTSSGSGNVFVVRPSAVIGLLTDVTVSSNQKGSSTGAVSSSALAGANFWVTVTPESGQGTPTITPNYPITYDSRYVQISTNLFQALSTQCLAIAGGCFISFNQSTVSAHSFDWVVSKLSSGNYGVTVNWADTLGGSGISQSLTCVGPVNMTVQQNKIFNFNSVNSF